ncbi:hypothetical protein QAD02_001197 [Eretmocerus hayati]|uniref:Uncharacterized protein n=1 Tax=Eretmocerus hayati TaxID=131215 RepID=A0ACC2NFJ9_9HYME|nr:hypothetical protein QAD02_001197 [Eretmocerus hayati]
MGQNEQCGFCGIHPKWLQSCATTKTFIVVYGLLGIVQSMAFIYIVVTLSTLEKRFKIASQTTGILLSGNEISQILSIVLIYYGGAGHRPRWIAVGVAISAVSCFILTLPHFIYGPGADALALTEEYFNASHLQVKDRILENKWSICPGDENERNCEKNDQGNGMFPRLLVFFSQIVLGIGTTLYYGLGQTYMDDNTKKKYSPIMFGFTFAMRTVGPVFGFFLSYFCLKFYIDPNLHPIIPEDDPRWLGAWWLGWIILGIAMTFFAMILSMFPRTLKKTNSMDYEENNDRATELCSQSETKETGDNLKSKHVEEVSLNEFIKAMGRLFMNKILMCNILSTVFYILSASGYFNFISKYLEVQFQTSSGGGSVVTGPLTMVGMICGFLISGFVISRYNPSARSLLMWNIYISVFSLIGQVSFIFLGCRNGAVQGINFETMRMNLTAPCNIDCNCESVKYSPVCHEPTGTTFYSACHAGCQIVINGSIFGHCYCTFPYNLASIDPDLSLKSNNAMDSELVHSYTDQVVSGPCKEDCSVSFTLFTIVTILVNILTSSGRVGNVIVNYRCVEIRDKSLAQGIGLVMISLFAMIPGPIIFGAIMDSTCLIWDTSCKERGNCWFYHRENFRFYMNSTASALCFIEVMFDIAVWYLSKDLKLYDDEEDTKKMAEAGMECKI